MQARLLVLGLVLALAAAACGRSSGGGATCPGEHCLPAFDARTLDGGRVSRESLRGKIVLVNFWATWCQPCVGEMPVLRALQEKYADRGLVVVGLLSDVRADDDTARAFLADVDIHYPNARVTPEIERAFRPPPYLPATYLYDARGVRVWGWTRAIEAAEVEDKLRPLVE